MYRWSTLDTVVVIIAVLFCIVTLYPIIYVFSCSISDPKMVLAGKVILWPVGFSIKAYGLIMENPEFWRSFINSILYVLVGCVLAVFNAVAVAWPLTRRNLKFRKFLTYYLLIPMFFAPGMIPAFLVIDKLGMYNSPAALIFPLCYNIWEIILCRTYMASLPEELIDSSLIDGCNQIQTLVKIVLPLSKPVIAVILIYTIVGVWNSWFHASIYTTNKAIQPVQLYLRNILAATSGSTMNQLTKNMSREALERYKEVRLASNQIKYAMIVLTIVPIIMVYPMFQKHFTKGVMVGSLKG